MPVNPGNTMNKGTAMIDGGTYTLYTRHDDGNRRLAMRRQRRQLDAVLQRAADGALVRDDLDHRTLQGLGRGGHDAGKHARGQRS